MHSMTFFNRNYFFVLVLVLCLGSCKSPEVPHGVILWSADETVLSSGTLVKVLLVSEIQRIIRVETLDLENKVTVQVDPWRIKVFQSKKEASTWVDQNSQWLDTFALCLRQALPVRERPDRSASTVYRLREGEMVKVLTRRNEKSDEGGLIDYWYEIMTENGSQGWTFGLNLQMFKSGQELSVSGKTQSMDVMSALQQNVWRPEYFDAMIKSRRYDLARFQAFFGFFVDPLSRTYRLMIPGYLEEGLYSSISLDSSNEDAQIYVVLGSSITLSFVDDSTLDIQYTSKDERRSVRMLNVKASVSEIVAEETARRTATLRALSRGGTGRFGGEDKGTLQFDSSNFSWPEAATAVPKFIGEGAVSGRAEIDRYHDPVLAPDAQGVLSLYFDSNRSTSAVFFLYKRLPGGIELQPISGNAFKDAVQQEKSFEKPFIMMEVQ